VRAGELGGGILIGRWTPGEMAATTRQLHAAGCAIGRPLLLLVDQEGGSVRRLPWAPPAQTAHELGLLGLAHTRAEAKATATALRAAGIDVDLAPVSDTLRPGGFLGSRTFGSDPVTVGNHVAAFIGALQAGRIAATAKHFPGLGAARLNTDDHAVSVPVTDLDPFRRAIAAGTKLVMVSNASYPALDNSGTPAVFSRPIVTDLLRGTFGFGGVVVTDALDAPTPAHTPHAPARALAAGVDLLLYTKGAAAHAGYLQLAGEAKTDSVVRADVARAVAHIRALKRWLKRSC
jgi:beta-N-acetylhexosaminidase